MRLVDKPIHVLWLRGFRGLGVDEEGISLRTYVASPQSGLPAWGCTRDTSTSAATAADSTGRQCTARPRIHEKWQHSEWDLFVGLATTQHSSCVPRLTSELGCSGFCGSRGSALHSGPSQRLRCTRRGSLRLHRWRRRVTCVCGSRSCSDMRSSTSPCSMVAMATREHVIDETSSNSRNTLRIQQSWAASPRRPCRRADGALQMCAQGGAEGLHEIHAEAKGGNG